MLYNCTLTHALCSLPTRDHNHSEPNGEERRLAVNVRRADMVVVTKPESGNYLTGRVLFTNPPEQLRVLLPIL